MAHCRMPAVILRCRREFAESIGLRVSSYKQEVRMSPESIFRTHLLLGYAAWLLCFSVYILPRLRSMDRVEAHRAIATLHSFRFFGLAFLLPGVVGSGLPAGFASFIAYGDFATGLLALLALLTVRI